MSTTSRVGRLGVLAVGLGIGAAVAFAGTASADDIQISIDGFDLFPTAGNTATATSGMGDIAIAIGANSNADAEGGIGDFASAVGTHTDATAGDPFGGGHGDNFDAAFSFGYNTASTAGILHDPDPVPTASNDLAMAFDPTSTVGASAAGGDGNFDFGGTVGDGLVQESDGYLDFHIAPFF